MSWRKWLRKYVFLLISFFSPVLLLHSSSVSIVISQPGTYTFSGFTVSPTDANDSMIVVAANNVTIDLSGSIYTQDPLSLASEFNGITVLANMSNIGIKTGTIQGITGIGILVNEGCSNINVDNVATVSCDRAGIEFLGTVANPIIQSQVFNCRTFSCSSGHPGPVAFSAVFVSCTELAIEGYDIYDNVNTGTFAPFFAAGCRRSSFKNLSVKNNQAGLLMLGIATFNGSNNIFDNCQSIENSATGTGLGTVSAGFIISGNLSKKNIFMHCIALQNFGGRLCSGFFFDDSPTDILMQNCLALQNAGINRTYGFLVNSSLNKSSFLDCLAAGNTVNTMYTGSVAGYSLNNGTDVQFIRCMAVDQTAKTAVGFDLMNSVSCVFQECQAYRNEGTGDANSFGFRINGNTQLPDTGGNIFIGNIASNNGGIASNQMNNFVPGVFSNIGYSSLGRISSPFTNIGIVPTCTTCSIPDIVDLTGVYTSLTDIKNTVIANLSGGSCAPTLITQALINSGGGTFTISTAGHYMLAGNIVASGAGSAIIRIDASDVTLDCCSNAIIGTAGNTAAGIEISSNMTHVTVKNSEIRNMNQVGIRVLNGCYDLALDHITTISCAFAGIRLNGTGGTAIRNSTITNCNAYFCSTAATTALGGLALQNCNSIIVNGGEYNHNGSNSATSVAGVLLSNCYNCKVSDLTMNLNTGPLVNGLLINTGNNNLIENCVAHQNSGSGLTNGFSISGLNNTIIHCQALKNSSTGNSCNGFRSLNGNRNIIEHCTASDNTGTTVAGFLLGTNETDSSIINCFSKFNIGTTAGKGILIDGASGAAFNTIRDNAVVQNNDVGIEDTAANITMLGIILSGSSKSLVTGNIAIDNGSASSFVPNFRNYRVAYAPTGTLVTAISSFSAGGPQLATTGANRFNNLDIRA